MSISPAIHSLTDDGVVPNNPDCPVLVYADAISEAAQADDPASLFEQRFAANGWPAAWRNGVFPYHHYHSTSHEALACYSGEATVQLGGEHGVVLTLSAGDVVVIPAGVAHKRLDASIDFGVVGAYPAGRNWDMKYAKPQEREAALRNIAAVPVPQQDPLFGEGGPLPSIWREPG